MSKPPPTVWMYGGGTQSAAIAALIVQGRIPTPDWAIIADTGRERASTWQYLRTVVQPHLDFRIYIANKERLATVDLYSGADKDTLVIPAFTNESGDVAKLDTYCSNEWKTRVCHRWLREQGLPAKYQSWIGYSIDEPRRWLKRRESAGDQVWFPLVDGIETNKVGCREIVASMGWPPAPSSHCWMCPNMNDKEWLELTKAEMKKAVALDKAIRQKDPNVFLHRSCVPLDQVKFDPRRESPEPCDSGVCFA